MMKLKSLLFSVALLGVVGWGPFSFFSSTPASSSKPISPTSADWIKDEMRIINSQANNIDQTVLKLSLHAYLKARDKGMDQKQLLTIIDYSKPSSERRLWVVDMHKGKVLFNTWVTHGKNSGNLLATSFSNQPSSLKSSIGVFLTDLSYNGGNGYSLRLRGLERGINDNAYNRDIVVHGAWYADPGVIKTHGQIGRSWGCPAVSPTIAQPLINTIKENTLLVAYYPDANWLKTSAFVA
jgi:hypothetical protein